MKVPHQITGRTRPSAQPLAYLSSAGATPEAFGAGIGRGLSSLAAGIEANQLQTKQREEKTDRFTSLTNFSAFETSVNEQLIEAKRNADPSGKGFTAMAESIYAKAEADFLTRDVAPELREEFTFRSSQVKQRILGDALSFQYQAGDAYFRTGIDKEYQSALKGLNPETGGSPEQLEAYRTRVFETIDASDLSEIEKEELKLKTSIGLEGVTYKSAVKQQVASGMVGDPYDIIRKEEGFRATPYWDVNAYRVGYGSDTITRADGSVERVKPGMRITREDAERDLVRRHAGFADVASKQVGGAWDGLSGNAKAALVSVAYNYGSLPRSVTAAAQTGDPETLAAAVAGLKANPDRRKREAAMIRGGGDPSGSSLDSDPRFANLPYEDRLSIRADGEREVAAEAARAIAAQQLAIDTQVNDLLNGIADGTRGQTDIDAGYEEGWLGDYDTRKKAQDALDKKTEDTRFLATAAAKASDEYSVWDPTSDDDKKMLNSLFEASDGPRRLTAADTEYFSNGIIPLVQRTNDIPTDVMGMLTGMVRSNNQTQSLFALDALMQLQEADPRAYDHRVSDTLAADVEFYRQRKDLYPADELMRMINGGNTTEERQARTLLQKQAQEILATKESGTPALQTLVGEVVEGFSGWTSAANLIAVPAFAKSLEFDYQTAFTDAFVKTGDKDLAHDMAVQTLQRNWGVTSVGGRNTLMKHPPEKVGYRPLGGDYSWIDRQLRTELGLSESESFELISDDKTKQEYQRWQQGLGGPASYQVVTYDEFGTPRLRTGPDGKPERRFFEATEEDKAAEVQAFDQRRAKLALDEFNRLHEGALLLELQQGIPVPEELKEEKARLEEQLRAVTPVPQAPAPIDPSTLPDTPGMRRKRTIEGM